MPGHIPHRLVALALLAGLLLAPARSALAWAHQGHILITRLACLRIIDDPQAPAGLKAFLQANLAATRDDCARLALSATVGPDATGYLTGLDGACTLPDRIQTTAEGRKALEPYGLPESRLHFIDLEYFAPHPAFQDDLSNLPAVEAFPRDVKDPRYRESGFLPLRTDDVYRRFVAALGPPDRPINNTEAVHWLGYLAHYLEDAHQPQHGTMDYKSLSYLVGKVPGVSARQTRDALGNALAVHRSGPEINPHGDVEYQLFENSDAPRGALRRAFWQKLQDDLAALAAHPDPRFAIDAGRFDGFATSLNLVHNSYGFLPLIGRAAQAAYASGKFDPAAFYTFGGTAEGRAMTVLDMIALQNARATMVVAQAIRAAWREARDE